ncbi:Cyclin-dependent kinase 8 [Colletotrichum sp. SAR 10_99]|nr:Cyclin-dependent kinase 8 [Colletotrichum sp. SAR 10_96]KAJ5014187.1 Cyclin-dependent kinase 8 [Colletotrichum sp. SAR 10_99]
MPTHPNHIVAGQKMYTTGHLRVMRETLGQARKTGEFPNTASLLEDPKAIVEDYQLLERLRDVRGNPSKPPPKQYNLLRIEIARRIKTRDEAEGGSTRLEEMDNRIQSWMGSINKEARMLEITQAALQRKGISNPTQADLDAIAEEFMQIAERTLLDVANPLRMNATRMEGNISRFDNQLSGFDGAMTAQLDGMSAQLNGLSDLNSAVNTSMSAQVNTLNTVLTNLQANMSKAVGASAEAMSNAVGTSTNAMSTAMASQLGTLNTMLSTQSSTFDSSLNMLNTSLNTVTSDLHQLTANLPNIIAAAAQAAVQQQLANTSHQHAFPQQHHWNHELSLQPITHDTEVRKPNFNNTIHNLIRRTKYSMAPEKPVSRAAANSRSAIETHRASNKHSQNEPLEKVQIPAAAKPNKDSVVDKKATNRRPPPLRRPATHQLPSEEQKKANGRYTGRKLVQWNRQPVAEKFLLALAFECEKKGIELPWDEAAHRFRPNVTGNAARQYVTKMSKRHLEEGRVVPPRGDLRRFDNRDTWGVVLDRDTGEPRAVSWDEDVHEPDKFPVDEQTVTIEEEEDAALALTQMGIPQMGFPMNSDHAFSMMPAANPLPLGDRTELPGAHQFAPHPSTLASVPDLNWEQDIGSADNGSELPQPDFNWLKFRSDDITDEDERFCQG